MARLQAGSSLPPWPRVPSRSLYIVEESKRRRLLGEDARTNDGRVDEHSLMPYAPLQRGGAPCRRWVRAAACGLAGATQWVPDGAPLQVPGGSEDGNERVTPADGGAGLRGARAAEQYALREASAAGVPLRSLTSSPGAADQMARRLEEQQSPSFTREEYEALYGRADAGECAAGLHGDGGGWTFEETARLFALCRQYSLRFVVIADRLADGHGARRGAGPARTVVHLRSRYHRVKGDLCRAQSAGQSAVAEYDRLADERRRQAGERCHQERAGPRIAEEAMLSLVVEEMHAVLPLVRDARLRWMLLCSSGALGNRLLSNAPTIPEHLGVASGKNAIRGGTLAQRASLLAHHRGLGAHAAASAPGEGDRRRSEEGERGRGEKDDRRRPSTKKRRRPPASPDDGAPPSDHNGGPRRRRPSAGGAAEGDAPARRRERPAAEEGSGRDLYVPSGARKKASKQQGTAAALLGQEGAARASGGPSVGHTFVRSALFAATTRGPAKAIERVIAEAGVQRPLIATERTIDAFQRLYSLAERLVEMERRAPPDGAAHPAALPDGRASDRSAASSGAASRSDASEGAPRPHAGRSAGLASQRRVRR